MDMLLNSTSGLDNLMGLEVYGTTTPGIKGALRRRLEDFVVEEVPLHSSSGSSTGPYMLLVIEKRGVDTLTVALRLSRKLRIPLNRVGFAGLKDARSVSRQPFTVKLHGSIDDVSGLEDGNIRIIAVGRTNKPLRPGMHYGNRFSVTISGVEINTSDVDAILEDLRAQINDVGGIPNFYGYQRFGLTRSNTHIIGRLLLLERYEEAVMELLKPSSLSDIGAERPACQEASLVKLLQALPKRLVFERMIVKHLLNNKDDYLGAVKRLPKRLLTLYIDAYFSYVFNKALSKRLRKMGSLKKLLEGDIVAKTDTYGNPLRPTRIVKEPCGELEEQEAILAFIPVTLRGVEGYMSELTSSIMKDDGLEPPFRALQVLNIRGRTGLLRQIAFKPLNLTYQALEGGLTLNFFLPRSSYATILLREVIKPNDPLAAGF
ncbi:MAG: tRNA pseudouridine(13) synthase TruD [Candidatus Nezhaarchaeota archaeon]|nr:tRNA pseudouridine(13) synthase TruD [Candidatus Nezhaarchaeota archaeon]